MKPKIILDSGAYSAFTKGKQIDIDKYLEFSNKHKSQLFGQFTLDKIGDAKTSYTQWKYLLDAGLTTIPVFHIGSDEIWLKKYMRLTDYIGIGAVANMSSTQRKLSLTKVFNKFFINAAGEATCKTHGLGLTAQPIVEAYPWYSVDSFTPMLAGGWGSLYLPGITIDGFDFTNLKGCFISSERKHVQGIYGSFLSFPKSVQMKYIQLFEQHGIDVGQLYYQVPVNKRKLRLEGPQKQKVKGIFNLGKVPEKIDTLTNDWKVRTKWNLLIWDKYSRLIPKKPFNIDGRSTEKRPLLFIGCSNKNHVRLVEDTKSPIHILVSFAFYNKDDMMEHLFEYKNSF